MNDSVEVKAQEPTCTEDGNIVYWYCADYGKYFSDATLTKEISRDDTMIPALGQSKENESTDNPKIGDSGMTLWISLAAISALGLVGTIILNKKRRTGK
ncbi:hypothetical protein [Massiliimalia timonensis]|uniref:hypothetical protein n=1 Tax=Massiliimalia timonensis TaxID=1987501 RepID=UPI000B8A81AD|nr:hypothetical protein [Massiliimalia timonensis]MBS7176456.1 hypothetical protein [Clostridiales bacterium]